MTASVLERRTDRVTTGTERVASDFAPLLNRIRDAGLLKRRRIRYAGMIGLDLALTGLVAWCVVALAASWWVVALGVPAAILTARAGFLGHDACHSQIAASKRANRLLALLHGNLLVGMSAGWWTAKHTRHHANPNHVGKDPDISAGALVWTADQARGRAPTLRWLTNHQAQAFFPMLLLEGLNLKLASVVFLAGERGRTRVMELMLIAVHLAAYLGFLFTVLSPMHALCFIAVHEAVFGLHLGCAFAPNHKGMPMPEPGERWGHLKKQVLTARNVRGGRGSRPVIDWMLGGLNYQIEHHLFPSMPRANLRHAVPVVRAYCRSLGMPYVEAGVISSYRQALTYLREVGELPREW